MAMTPEDMQAMDAYFKQKYGNGQTPYQGAKTPGMMGMGDIVHNANDNAAHQELAGEAPDDFAGALGASNGTNLAASGHGVMSPFEAAANGLKTAVGMGLMAKNMDGRKSAIAKLLRKKPTGTELPDGVEAFQQDPSVMTDAAGDLQFD